MIFSTFARKTLTGRPPNFLALVILFMSWPRGEGKRCGSEDISRGTSVNFQDSFGAVSTTETKIYLVMYFNTVEEPDAFLLP
jgi:hypothetical protein